MDEMESLSHAKWECQYHGVCIPKCRRKTLYGELRRHLGGLLRKLADQRRVGSKKGACARSGRETFVGQHFWAAGGWVSTVDRPHLPPAAADPRRERVYPRLRPDRGRRCRANRSRPSARALPSAEPET